MSVNDDKPRVEVYITKWAASVGILKAIGFFHDLPFGGFSVEKYTGKDVPAFGSTYFSPNDVAKTEEEAHAKGREKVLKRLRSIRKLRFKVENLGYKYGLSASEINNA